MEIYGYLLCHYAISALICRAATEADIDPDRIKFKRTATTDIINYAAAGIGDKGYQGADLYTPTKKPQWRTLNEGEKVANAALCALRAPVERAVSHFKSWRILHTDYRRPYATYREPFDAARAFFFSIKWGFE